MVRSIMFATLASVALTGCGGGGGNNDSSNPPDDTGNPPTGNGYDFNGDAAYNGVSASGACDVRYIAGISTDGTAFFEMDKRNLYVVDGDCLFGDDEIHVAESAMDEISEAMSDARDEFTNSSDIEIGECSWVVKGSYAFNSQTGTILNTSSLLLEDSTCGQDLFAYSTAFDQAFIHVIGDAVLRGHAEFADGDVGRITFDFLESRITDVD